MSIHKIPARGKDWARIDKIKDIIRESLREYITGRDKEKKLDMATDACFLGIKAHLRIPKTPELGATIMTEGASQNSRTGPKNL